MKGIWKNPAAAAANKDKNHRRRPNRRPNQNPPPFLPVNSLLATQTDLSGDAEEEGPTHREISMSCPFPMETPGRWVAKKKDSALEEAIKAAFHNRLEVIVSEAQVVGLGRRFMSVHINKFAIERRIYYNDVEGLTVEWLEATGTLVLDLHWNQLFQSSGPCKLRAIENVALVLNPSEVIVTEEDTSTNEVALGSSTLAPLGLAEKSETIPAFFPLVLQRLSPVSVAVHAVGGDDSPLDIGVRLYTCSYFS